MSASRTVLITEAWLAGVAADEPRSKPAKLPEGVVQLEYRDTRQIGFGVTVGRRFATFFVQRRVDGRRKMVTIGRYGQPGAGADHGERWTVACARRSRAARRHDGARYRSTPCTRPRLDGHAEGRLRRPPRESAQESVAQEAGVSELDQHVLTNHSYATYIAQHIDHLAACQAKIEAALKRKLRPAPKPTHKPKARGQLKAVA